MKKYLFVILICAVLLLGFFLASKEPRNQAIAGAGQNVFGWAWSETTGWLGLNCSNCQGNPLCDKTATCNGAHPDYGVHIADDGIMSGYAWSENLGWLSFNTADTAACPTSPCQARVDLDTGLVYGWARFLAPVGNPQAGGWDGWVRLRGANYGVSLDFTSKEFRGFAFADNIVGGWVSFNSLNCDSNNNGVSDTGNFANCPTGASVARYFVKTTFSFPPRAINLSAQATNLCSTPSQTFSFVFQDRDPADTQSAYQLQVDKEGTFAVFTAGEVDTGKVFSAATNIAVLIAKNPSLGQLAYNSTYSWRLKVWDSNNTESLWYYGTNFTLLEHICPTPNFQWQPPYPSQGQVAQLCAVSSVDCAGYTQDQLSVCYDGLNNPISCAGKTFLWTLPGTASFEPGSAPASENPKVKFSQPGPWDITLKITDNAGNCSIVKQIRIYLPLPEWQETSPQ